MSRVRFYVMGFAVLAFFDTLTQVSLKLASQQTGDFVLAFSWFHAALASVWVYGAVAGYLGAFVTWMKLLEEAPVGPAFAASHLDVVTVLLISVPLFGERLRGAQILGAIFVVAGILLLSLSESKEPSEEISVSTHPTV